MKVTESRRQYRTDAATTELINYLAGVETR
jgi:hypothetical protein